MHALKLVGPGTLGLEDVEAPRPGPGEVRIRVAGAGLCHSDLHVLHAGADWPVFGGTIGHEGAGWIDMVGPGVDEAQIGEPVVVSVLWNCGLCRLCSEGRDNACLNASTRTTFPTTPGIGPDGAMAEFMVAPFRSTVPLGSLDPVDAAPLSDAAVTPMHAINTVLDRLTPSSTVVVIGLGGLGHVGVQILSAISAARIIAVDTDPAKVEAALGCGAHLALVSDDSMRDRIMAETDDRGAEVVLDFVGAQGTVDLATQIVAAEGAIRFVGLARGSFVYSTAPDDATLPWGVNVQRSYGGTRRDLVDVVSLAQRGAISIHTVHYALADYQRAFDDLEAGRVAGRAVFLPTAP
jgi:propanol-preferring alcohol dehydrogenase